jgi:hypothetical protein
MVAQGGVRLITAGQTFVFVVRGADKVSMEYIRRTYGVPAQRGARVHWAWPLAGLSGDGTIIGSRGAHLRLRLDGWRQTVIAHPTWLLTYIGRATEVRGDRQ